MKSDEELFKQALEVDVPGEADAAVYMVAAMVAAADADTDDGYLDDEVLSAIAAEAGLTPGAGFHGRVRTILAEYDRLRAQNVAETLDAPFENFDVQFLRDRDGVYKARVSIGNTVLELFVLDPEETKLALVWHTAAQQARQNGAGKRRYQ